MNIKEAYEELEEMYPGANIEASYLLNNFSGEARGAYQVYHEGGPGPHFGKGDTWRQALENLKPKDPAQDEPCEDGEGHSTLDLDQIAHEERLEDARQERLEVMREKGEGIK